VELITYRVKKVGVEILATLKLFDIKAAKELLGKAPSIVVVSGRGVMTKEVSAGGIVETVTSDPETFVWTNSSDGHISFIRRSRLAEIMERLAETGITVLYTECLQNGGTDMLATVAERFYSEHLKWKRVLKPTTEGSGLASLIAKRVQLPILGVLLALLVINFVLSRGIRDDFQQANSELIALQKTHSATAKSGDRRQTAFEEFSHTFPHRFSRLSDRIAVAIPEKVIINKLSIAPIKKALEAGKPIQQSDRLVVISGESPSAESVASFVESLGALDIGTVMLSSVEQNSERSLLTFLIEIEL
jgi:hypothetical protein